MVEHTQFFLYRICTAKWWYFSPDSQDEDNDVFVAKEQRRFAHSAAEQKRRDAIRVSVCLKKVTLVAVMYIYVKCRQKQ